MTVLGPVMFIDGGAIIQHDEDEHDVEMDAAIDSIIIPAKSLMVLFTLTLHYIPYEFLNRNPVVNYPVVLDSDKIVKKHFVEVYGYVH